MRSRDERGASAVEFALVMPILILVIFGIINFGVLFAQNLALSNGARQAARLAAVEGNTCDDVRLEARSNVTSIAMPNVEAMPVDIERTGDVPCATQACDGAASGDSAMVTLTYASDLLVPFPPFPNTITLTAVGEFRCEYW